MSCSLLHFRAPGKGKNEVKTAQAPSVETADKQGTVHISSKSETNRAYARTFPQQLRTSIQSPTPQNEFVAITTKDVKNSPPSCNPVKALPEFRMFVYVRR